MKTRLMNLDAWLEMILILAFVISTQSGIAGGISGAKAQQLIQQGDQALQSLRQPKLILPPSVTSKSQNRYVPNGITATFVVTNTNDAGLGSFREALIGADSVPGSTISFAIPGAGVHTIVPLSGYSVIYQSVYIDGWSQGGSGYTGTPLIEIDGINVIGGIGLNIQASNTVVRGLAITRFQQFPSLGGNGIGIGIFSATSNVWIYGCHIGVDASGMIDRGNAQIGVWLGVGADGNTIGTNADGTNDLAERNVISGNDSGDGILMQSDNNTVAGNFIGINITGTDSIRNDGSGIRIALAASGNIIGGSLPVARNVISGNRLDGILVEGTGIHNLMNGNFIGTDISGNIAMGNKQRGLNIFTSSNQILNNVIAGNIFSGIVFQNGTSSNIVRGNFVGTNQAGTTAIPNHNQGINVFNSTNNIIGDVTPAGRNILSGNNLNGIIIQGTSTGNIVRGNFIGTNTSGTGSISNLLNGIYILNGASGNIIGGTIPAEGNIISGNSIPSDTWGVLIDNSSSNVVSGNYIGVDVTGTSALPNGVGVVIMGNSTGNVIGGTSPGARNIISGNNGYFVPGGTGNGIAFGAQGTSGGALVKGNFIQGNFIGTDYTGTAAIPNTTGGIVIRDTANNNVVGGTLPGACNIISGNTETGILIKGLGTFGNLVEGNYVGTDVTGTLRLPNLAGGITICDTASGNIIGGAAAGARNIISGNGLSGEPLFSGHHGVIIAGPYSGGNRVIGNYIGTDATGTIALPNSGDGVQIYGHSYNTLIGGPTSAERNIISGNAITGISIFSADSNTVIGNYVGVDPSGSLPLGNVGGSGIWIGLGGTYNRVGGTTPGERNILSGNGWAGIGIGDSGTSHNLALGNFIGTNAAGTAKIGNTNYGVLLNGGTNNIIGGTTPGERNLISGNTTFGVYITGGQTTNNVLEGNFIGTDATGTVALDNFNAVYVYNAPHNRIGGTAPGAGNLISGNGFGLAITGDGSNGNIIQGNLIGTDVTGTLPLGNIEAGIGVSYAYNTVIGGSTPGARNVISGNIGDGILIAGFGTGGHIVQGNFIGTATDGITPLANIGNGITFTSAFEGSPGGNTIGGTASGEGNVIAYNDSAGISVQSGRSNAILGNSIYRNGLIGIDLGADGVTANDAGDVDFGANNLLNFPILDFAASDLEGIQGSIHSTPGMYFTIEFFKSSTADPSGFGEGQTYIGAANVLTDGGGDATFYVTLPGMFGFGDYISATATDSEYNTSEFSATVAASQKIKAFGNHYVINTTVSGVPLHWADGKATYMMSNSIPSAFRSSIQNGFATWDALPQLTMTNGGPTTSPVWGGNPDGINNITWIQTGWDDSTGSDSNTIAVTRVRYNTLNGEMTDVDIAFDAEHFLWTIVDDTAAVEMNVQNVATHEEGHFNGLGDIYDPGQPGYITPMGSGNREVSMFGFIRHGEFKKNTLEQPDTAGIGYIYSHIPDSKIDLVLVFDGSSTFAGTYNGFTPSKNSSLELIQKMRTGDRIGVVRMPDQTAFSLTEITGQATKDAARSAVQSLLAGGKSAVGAGLSTAQSALDAGGAPNHTKAMILFSASEEDSTPSALSVLPSIAAASTEVYTLGFNNSSGQPLSDTIATRTNGAYYKASDVTIGNIVDQIWNRLIGQQLLTDTVVASNNVPGFPQPGLKWQGAVDPGTSSIQPGLKWQGSNFILTLLDPNNLLIDSASAAASATDDVEYFSGPTFAYFNIKHPIPGTWTLIVQGRVFPPQPEPLNLYILSYTDLTMSVLFNKGSYAPGEEILVSAELSRGGVVGSDKHVVGGSAVTDATVNGIITIPGTPGTQPLVLTHTGGGIYKGAFTNTVHSGSYDFRISASKPDDFQRQVFQSVYVDPPFSCLSNIVVNSDPDQCSAVVNYVITPFPGVTVVSTPPSGSTFPKGSTTVVSVGTDALGHNDTCKFIVTVYDKQPPTISGENANPNLLGPPNHKMVNVTINYSTSDNCGPTTSSISVKSNEPLNGTGDGDMSPDWIIKDPHHLQLRAERAGNGYGRVYSITISSVDGSGNVATKVVRVVVPKGNLIPIGSGEDLSEVPVEYKLDQNHPNPFNPTTLITYALPAESKVTLTIYNTLGQAVRTLVDEVQDAGFKTASFDAGEIASGLYFYRIEAVSTKDPANSFTRIRKMLLVK